MELNLYDGEITHLTLGFEAQKDAFDI